jgi:hypothetical protein
MVDGQGVVRRRERRQLPPLPAQKKQRISQQAYPAINSTGKETTPSNNNHDDDCDQVECDDNDCARAHNYDETEFDTATTPANSMTSADIERGRRNGTTRISTVSIHVANHVRTNNKSEKNASKRIIGKSRFGRIDTNDQWTWIATIRASMNLEYRLSALCRVVDPREIRAATIKFYRHLNTMIRQTIIH